MRFMAENRSVTGEEALTWEVAGEVADDDKFTERLAASCASLSAWSPITLRLSKRGLVRGAETVDMEQQLRLELANIRRAFVSRDAEEARRAFPEKRRPTFVGK